MWRYAGSYTLKFPYAFFPGLSHMAFSITIGLPCWGFIPQQPFPVSFLPPSSLSASWLFPWIAKKKDKYFQLMIKCTLIRDHLFSSVFRMQSFILIKNKIGKQLIWYLNLLPYRSEKRKTKVSLFKNWLTKAWLRHLVDWPFRLRSCHSPLLPLNNNLTPCHIPSLVIILICRTPGLSKTVNSWSFLQIGRLCYGSMNTASPKCQKFLKHVYLTLGYNFVLTFEMCVAAV